MNSNKGASLRAHHLSPCSSPVGAYAASNSGKGLDILEEVNKNSFKMFLLTFQMLSVGLLGHMAVI